MLVSPFLVSVILQFPFAASPEQFSVAAALQELGPSLFTLGWLIIIFLTLWVVWDVYVLLKMIDYVSAIEWTFLQIKVPPDSAETPKAMEIAYDVLDGIHKGPDLVEKYFDGYLEPWYSCEIQCLPGRARYIMVVPTNQRNFFEGVIYGQYPRAEIKEVEDYTQRYDWHDLRKKFDLYGTTMILAKEDYYPLKTYREYENVLAEDDKYTDPHQSMVEALTNSLPGEEYWIQVVIRPMDFKLQSKWAAEGEAAVAEIAGQGKEETPGLFGAAKDIFKAIPGELFAAAFRGPVESMDEKDKQSFRFFNPIDEAKMKGITLKIAQQAHKTVVRIIHIAPPGQVKKPNYGRLIGTFKQFNTLHLNNIYPDPTTKSNGPNFVFRETRRKFRERNVFLQFQWRDHWGVSNGQWFSSEELATLFHLPVKYVKTPGIEHSKSGLQSPPPNLPYAQ